MKTLALITLATCAATTALAEETRQLDAHEHGVGQLDIAFDGAQIAMELHAPGADIVGFEYAATSAQDRARVDTAVATLARPLDLFALPAEAGCSVVQASASLESEAVQGDHDDAHDHEEAHDHDDHNDAQDHEEAHAHEDHGDAHEGDDHAEADHDDTAGHTEFHAEYLLNCADPSAVTMITFAYFDTFPNALEVEVQLITDKGANAFEVARDAPALDLRGMF